MGTRRRSEGGGSGATFTPTPLVVGAELAGGLFCEPPTSPRVGRFLAWRRARGWSALRACNETASGTSSRSRREQGRLLSALRAAEVHVHAAGEPRADDRVGEAGGDHARSVV